MKKTMLLAGPLEHRSGYSEHARDIYENLKDEYDIDLINWETYDPKVNTGYSYVDKNNLKSHYDMFISVFVPDHARSFEFLDKKLYSFDKRINISAGIESDKVTQQWAEVSKYYDAMITSSEYSKQGFINSGVDEKKVFVIPEGVDLKKFFKDAEEPFFPLPVGKKIILTAGQIGLGTENEERKGIWLLIKEFYKVFKDDPNIVLAAKVRQLNYNSKDCDKILEKIKEYKKDSKAEVLLIHGELTTEEFRKLYSHPNIVACAYPTKGEGYGRHILESVACKKPVIAPFKTGQKDFLLKDCIFEIETTLAPVADIYKKNMPTFFTPDSQWEDIDTASLRKCLKEAVEVGMPQEKIEKAYSYIKKNHEINKCYRQLKKTLKTIMEPEVKNEQE